MIRIGILSLAHHHAESYLWHLMAMPDVEVVGLADDDRERAEQAASRFRVSAFDTYASLLAAGVDAAIVCSENSRHRPLVVQAAEAGAHVLCEKPLGTTVADCQAMIDACRRRGVHLMTAFPMRFSRPVLELKQVLVAGRLGRILGCNTTNNGQCPKHTRAWFVDRHLAGGGALMDHVVHLGDLLRWYLESEVVEVYARSNRILYADIAPDVETGGLLILTFDNGVFATVDCSWSRPLNYPTWGGLTVEIVGEDGFATLDAFKQRLTIYCDDAQRGRYAFWGEDADSAMLAAFVTSLRDGLAPPVSGEDGLKATEIVEAAYRSSELGEPVRLPQR